jgi:hypothetical protein
MDMTVRRSTPAVSGTVVTPYPIPRDQREGGIGDEFVLIVEPAMSIFTGPTLQLGISLVSAGNG